MYAKNELIKLKITDITTDGEGIGKTDAFTWFIKDTIPGDEIEATVMKVKKTYGYARLKKVLVASEDRIEARCPVARACGGCNLQNMNYDAQLAYKENKVKNNLKRIGGFDASQINMLPIIGMDDPWRYRNKAIVPFGRNKNGEVIYGFYAGHTHDIISCQDCLLGSEDNRRILEEVKAQYDDAIRYVLIKKGFVTGQTMVCIIARHKVDIHISDVTTVVLNINDGDGNTVLGDKTIILSGPGYIEDYIGELKFRISAKSFYQVNPIQVQKLYGKAVEFAALTGNETVWDLYCGIGTISLSLAKQAGKVYGVEIVPQAIEDAKKNAEINGITNAEFFVGKAEEVLPAFVREHGDGGVDVIVVDPPRKGCDSVCLQTMVQIAPEKIVYVSCDSATLARDLKYLCENGYGIEKIQCVDMFPQTVHVETCALLTRT